MVLENDAMIKRDPPTHPVFASLDYPLFRKRERGNFIFTTVNPLSAKGEERVDELSDVGVSQTQRIRLYAQKPIYLA